MKKNIIFQTIYQILNTCLPLITAPYLARVLGAEQQGIYSYTNSIVAYFTLFAMLGTVNYGTRTIASVKEDKFNRSKNFIEIYLLQVITSVILTIFYSIYLLFICKTNVIISAIQIILIISCYFDINWLFFGLEKFEKTVTRNIIVKIATVIFIILFVRTANDLWKYTLIMTLGTLISQLILWPFALKEINLVKVNFKDIFKHLKANFILFIPLLAMSIYHMMDKTMLGIMSNYTESGFYYNADKIINIPVGILTGISTVLLPRMTYLISKGEKKNADYLFTQTLEIVSVASIAIAVGIAAISKEFVPIFLGANFEKCSLLITILAPVLIIKGISISIRNQYLIPNKLENIFIFSVIIGAVTNLLCNYFLIPQYGSIGAVIGTLIAELVACIIQILLILKRVNIIKVMIKLLPYILISIVMFIIIRIFSYIEIIDIIKLTVEIILGVIIYSTLCIIYWYKTNNVILKEHILNLIKIKKQ